MSSQRSITYKPNYNQKNVYEGLTLMGLADGTILQAIKSEEYWILGSDKSRCTGERRFVVSLFDGTMLPVPSAHIPFQIVPEGKLTIEV